MQVLERQTLLLVREQMAVHPFSDDEISELVAPTRGIITGLPDLLIQLEDLRQVDLGSTPPETSIPLR